MDTSSNGTAKKAENNLIPRIDNTNVDKGLGIIHSTIIRCMRKFTENTPLFDAESKKPTVLLQEFNIVIKNKLSSKEAQDIISSRVNKTEIMKRFLEDQQKNMQTPAFLTDMFQPKSVDDNDVTDKKEENTKSAMTSTVKLGEASITPEIAAKKVEDNSGINTSKSQENIINKLQEKKEIKTKKKLVHIADPIKFKVDPRGEEDNMSALGSVVSYSVDVVTIEKSEDVSKVEEISEEEDEESDDDSIKAEADDKSDIHEVEGSGSSSDSDTDKKMREELRSKSEPKTPEKKVS